MNTQKHHTLYIIGGLSQTGKTTITQQIQEQKKLSVLHTDDLRHEVVIPPDQESEGLDDLAWPRILRAIQEFDCSSRGDFLIEGTVMKPERVQQLRLKNFAIRAAFIGYSREVYAEVMLARAKQTKNWVYGEIQKHGDEWTLAAVRDGIKINSALKELAQKFNYGYFDVTDPLFNSKALTEYLFG